MSGDEPASLAEAAQLRRLLQQLGHDGSPPRDGAQESAREARMAARMDAELEGLVKARRRRRGLFGLATVAALLALTFSLRHTQLGVASLGIAPEPVSEPKPKPAQERPESPRAVTAAPLPAPRAVPRPSSVGKPVVAPATSAVEPHSTLAEENQLFKDAAESARNGDVNDAVSRLDRLLVRYPASPLAQTALVRKFRLLAKAGRSDDARREAERYLAAYPTGFAVSEAQALRGAAAEKQDTP
jgi:hypothetical protein